MPRLIDKIKRKLNDRMQRTNRPRNVGIRSNQENINTIGELKEYVRNQDNLTQENVPGGPYGDSTTHIVLGSNPTPETPYLSIVRKGEYFVLTKMRMNEAYILGVADNEEAIVDRTLEEI